MYAEIGTCMEEYAYVCKTKSNIFLPKKTNTFDKQIYKCMHKHCKIMQKKTENMEIHINVLTVHGFQKYNNSSKNWRRKNKKTDNQKLCKYLEKLGKNMQYFEYINFNYQYLKKYSKIRN